MATTKESGSVPVFDTRGYVRTLVREGGVEEKQADAQADALQGALSGVSSKADIEVLKVMIRAFEDKTDARLQAQQDQMQAMRQMMFLGFSLIGTLVVVSTLLSRFG